MKRIIVFIFLCMIFIGCTQNNNTNNIDVEIGDFGTPADIGYNDKPRYRYGNISKIYNRSIGSTGIIGTWIYEDTTHYTRYDGYSKEIIEIKTDGTFTIYSYGKSSKNKDTALQGSESESSYSGKYKLYVTKTELNGEIYLIDRIYDNYKHNYITYAVEDNKLYFYWD